MMSCMSGLFRLCVFALELLTQVDTVISALRIAARLGPRRSPMLLQNVTPPPPHPCPFPRGERVKNLNLSLGVLRARLAALVERLGGKTSTRRNLITTNLRSLAKSVFLQSEHSPGLAHWMSPYENIFLGCAASGIRRRNTRRHLQRPAFQSRYWRNPVHPKWRVCVRRHAGRG